MKEQSVAGNVVTRERPLTATRRFSRKQLLAGGILAAAVLVWFVLFLTVGGDFYRTVGEVKAGGLQENIRVGGTVVPGTIQQQADGVRFSIEGEAGEPLEVAYWGPVPESLAALERAVVTGSMNPAGGFEATEVLVKCPDKLFPERVTNGLLDSVGLGSLLY
jgi:cytochrome c-type biogenesis protein CcmE